MPNVQSICNQYAINVRKMLWPWHPWHPWYRDVPGQHGATVPGDFVAIGLHMESGHPTHRSEVFFSAKTNRTFGLNIVEPICEHHVEHHVEHI